MVIPECLPEGTEALGFFSTKRRTAPALLHVSLLAHGVVTKTASFKSALKL